MRLALYQFAPVFGEWEFNLNKVRSSVSGVDCDLLVLPELALTGYQFVSSEELSQFAEPIPEGATCSALIELADEAGCHIVCGLPEKAGDTFYNSAVLVGPEGYIGKYRKVHLFCDEKLWFAPGNTGFEVLNVGGTKIGIIICFDWIFPEATRILALKGAQGILQPANLVLPWCQKVALARAWENRVFFVTANRTGIEKRGNLEELRFTGQSQAVTPDGELLFRLGEDEEALKIIEIDPTLADMKDVTPRNNILTDRRPELYSPLTE